MNVNKAKKLFGAIDELVKDLPWLGWSPVREVAARTWVMKMRLSTAHPVIFNEMKEQCQDIGRKLGKSWQSVFVYQMVYDIFQRNVTVASACTVGSVGSLFIRYMDWGIPEGIGRFTTNTKLTADDGSKYTSIGFPGFIGTVTCMGNGWCVAMNQSPVAGNDPTGVPSCYYTRLFAQRFAVEMNNGVDLKKAIKLVMAELDEENIKPMSSLILVARNSTHHAIIEHVLQLDPVVVVKSVSVPLAVSNHLGKANSDLNPDAEWEDEDGDLVENTTFDRQQQMLKVLKKLAPRRRLNLESIMAGIGDPVRNDLTAYAVLHNFADGDTLIRTE